MATNFRSSCYLVLQLFCLLLTIHVCKSEDGDSDTNVTNMPTSNSESDGNDNEEDSRDKLPTVFIPILARNKAHALPTFFAYLDRLNYPKDRISIW
ncbi:Glycosyltransferase 25 family member [Holothuria leucospilota]|uniref:Glycosyltransferase 25 family member n=1 Tax=Holothuria leucospilota TaxID=206669 RepID=A0A9Q1HAZ7_HOLLE|nr:Glycosyltransferase 25 family member [Holothuria leucospilota]